MLQGMDIKYATSILPKLLDSLGFTLQMALTSYVLAVLVGVVIALIRFYKVKILDALFAVYISFFRGTPLVAQLFLLYFGISRYIPFLHKMTGYQAMIIGVSLNTAAYMAEGIRGALESVDKGQLEAARSIGMTKLQTSIRILVPQAARIAVPTLSNNLIDVIKGTALAITIGVTDMMYVSQQMAAASFKFMECYIAVMLIYWIVSLVIGFLQNKLEVFLARKY